MTIFHAHGLFAAAQNELDAARATFGYVTVDSRVQSASITRDDGFTYVREAIREQELSARQNLLRQAGVTTERSCGVTDSIIRERGILDDGSTRVHILSGWTEEDCEILAEHGATLGLLGRMATVAYVLHGGNASAIEVRDGDDTSQPRQSLYEQAYYYACNGNNGYYRASIAMTGARDALLDGQLDSVRVWCDRAVSSLAWTAMHDDWRNAKAAARTMIHRTPHLRSYRAAEASVLLRP